MNKSLRKSLFTAFKIAISLALLYFVFNKINWPLLWTEWKTADKFLLAMAVVSYILSQLLSVVRVDLFFKKSGVNLSFLTNAKLYMLGMFYNFFIPGGIGGDAYKVYALHKEFDKSIKTLTSAVFFDRLIGLCAICILICSSVFLLPLEINNWVKWGAVLIAIISIVAGPRILGFIFPRFKAIFYPTLLYSFIIQGFQIGTIIFTLLAIHPESNILVYTVIFLISSILSIVSFAGIGIRETFFYYAASYLNFNPDIAAGIALNFSIITLVTSLLGIIYLFKKISFNK